MHSCSAQCCSAQPVRDTMASTGSSSSSSCDLGRLQACPGFAIAPVPRVGLEGDGRHQGAASHDCSDDWGHFLFRWYRTTTFLPPPAYGYNPYNLHGTQHLPYLYGYLEIPMQPSEHPEPPHTFMSAQHPLPPPLPPGGTQHLLYLYGQPVTPCTPTAPMCLPGVPSNPHTPSRAPSTPYKTQYPSICLKDTHNLPYPYEYSAPLCAPQLTPHAHGFSAVLHITQYPPYAPPEHTTPPTYPSLSIQRIPNPYERPHTTPRGLITSYAPRPSLPQYPL